MGRVLVITSIADTMGVFVFEYIFFVSSITGWASATWVVAKACVAVR